MGNSVGEQQQTRKEKNIIQKIGFKDFSAVCQEYQIIEKATRELLELVEKEDTPVRVKVDVLKWIVEMNIGKPRQMNDIILDTKDDKPEGIIIQYTTTKNDLEALERLEKRLLDNGVLQEDIDDAVSEGYENESEDIREEYNQQLKGEDEKERWEKL